MKLQLLAAVPHQRRDWTTPCVDGRGGLTLSQVDMDRCVARRHDAGLLLWLSMLVEPSDAEDYVQATRLVASMDGSFVGNSEQVWILPNRAGVFRKDAGIYSWTQSLPLDLADDGLVEIAVSAKLRSQSAFLSVEGVGYCHLVEDPACTERIRSLASFRFAKFLSFSSRLRVCGRFLRSVVSRGGCWRTRSPSYGFTYVSQDGYVPFENQTAPAFKEYEELAELGVVSAQSWCGEVHSMGLLDRKRNPEEGLRWLRAAIGAGDVRAKYLLAVLTVYGIGVAEDAGAAARLCQDAASSGNADAQQMLGLMYARGHGLARDKNEAIHWLKRASKVRPEARAWLRKVRKIWY